MLLSSPDNSSPVRRKRVPKTHKSDCGCESCSPLDRTQETITVSARARGTDVDANSLKTYTKQEVLNANGPPLVAIDRTNKGRVAQWVMVKAANPGMSDAEIAQHIGIAASSLKTLICQARREGWLIFEDPIAKLEYEVIPKVVDNLNHFLDMKDKQVTIETAKGTIFKQFQEAKGISDGSKTILALKFESPDGNTPMVVTGTIVGRPRQLEE